MHVYFMSPITGRTVLFKRNATLSKTVPLAPWAIQDNGLIPEANRFLSSERNTDNCAKTDGHWTGET